MFRWSVVLLIVGAVFAAPASAQITCNFCSIPVGCGIMTSSHFDTCDVGEEIGDWRGSCDSGCHQNITCFDAHGDNPPCDPSEEAPPVAFAALLEMVEGKDFRQVADALLQGRVTLAEDGVTLYVLGCDVRTPVGQVSLGYPNQRALEEAVETLRTELLTNVLQN